MSLGASGQAHALEARGISVRFGGSRALDGVDLVLRRGEIGGLIGPNGAGKTTLFNVVTGLCQPSSGSVFLDGCEITSWTPHRRARAGMTRTFQRLELFARMTVQENLLAAREASVRWAVFGRKMRDSQREVSEVMEMLGIAPLAARTAGDLPTGQGRLVELGRALCSSPKVILLDEPSSGLDSAETSRLGAILVEAVANQRGEMSALLVEHDMSLVMELCDSITVLDAGKRIAHGSPAEVRANPAVVAAYLGTEGGSSPLAGSTGMRAALGGER